MKTHLVLLLTTINLVLLLSVVGAAAQRPAPTGISPQAALGSAFTYQGRLTDNGNLANGVYDFEFKLYAAAAGGVLVGSPNTIIVNDQSVTDGLFTVRLDFGGAFTGAARYLEISVRPGSSTGAYTTLSPRQALTAAPYALGVAAPLTVSGSVAKSAIVSADNSDSTGAGVFGNGSAGGTGVNGNGGIGVLGQSPFSDGTGVRGFANVGDNATGVYGSSASGTGVSGESLRTMRLGGRPGVYGKGDAEDGGWFTSAKGNGVFAAGGNIGAYVTGGTLGLSADSAMGDAAHFFGNVVVNGDLTVTGSKNGYVTDIALNASTDALSPGDVVAVVGNTAPVVGAIPVARVVKATAAYQMGVIGVVSQRLIRGDPLRFDDQPAAPGNYLSVVTLGMFRAVKVDSAFGAIHAGDLLVASPHAGYAMKAADRTRADGAIVGKALGDLESGTGMVPVLVTLQ